MSLTSVLFRLLALCAMAPAFAQTPTDAPPWWGVPDDNHLSLYWNFSGPAPLAPIEVTTPFWYNRTVTRAVPSGPLQILPNFQGRTDVLAMVGTGVPLSASLAVTVDNDPHYNWIKIFFFQFDEFEGSTGSVSEALAQDLAKYKRSSMTTTKQALGNGWTRVTVKAQLIPQPMDEEIDFTFTEQALGTVAIDDLYADSKCVKIDEADQDGDAFGQTDGFAVDLSAATGNTQCLAAAVTQGPGPAFARTYWISGAAPVSGAVHQVFRLNQAGALISTTLLPDTLSAAPLGASDLAVVNLPGSAGAFVYAVLDLRTTSGAIALRALDANGSLSPTASIALTNLPPNLPPAPHRFGLAFQRTGDLGNGTFWLTDQFGSAHEFARSGAYRRSVGNLPTNVVGAGYDDTFGNFYWFSSQPRLTPSGPVQVCGYEWSGYDLNPTGAQFFGNLQLTAPSTPRGGVASGLEVYRRANGTGFRAVCVAQVGPRSMLYELKGPFRWGGSLLGTCGMQGLPFEGSNSFQVTLNGVPNANFASLYVGFGARPTPFSLGQFGLPESSVLINLDLNSALQLPVAPGRFAFNLPLLPPGSGFSYVPMFFQWLVFDPSVPGGVTLSPGGKTLVY